MIIDKYGQPYKEKYELNGLFYTLCKNCDHSYVYGEEDRWYNWYCTANPYFEWDYQQGIRTTRYLFCRDRNNEGECPFYEGAVKANVTKGE